MARGKFTRALADELGRALTLINLDELPLRGDPLLAEAGLHRHPLAALRAPTRKHLGAALGFHTRAKTMLLRAFTPVGLECALGHETSLLLTGKIAMRQTKSINDARAASKPE